MKIYTYSNEYQTYQIMQFNGEWTIWQDGVQADRTYKRLKDAKRAIDLQDVWF